MKRVILSTLVLCAALGSAWADAAKVEISMAYPVAVTAPIANIMNGYAAEFMAANPGVKVTLVFSGGYGDVKTAVQTAIQGKAKAPELAIMLATDVYDLVNARLIDTLDDLAAADKTGKAYLKDFAPAYMGNSYAGGKLYGIPFQRSAVVMYYNADLLAKEKIAVPATWDQLGKAAGALTVDGGSTRWGIECSTKNPYWLFEPFAIANGKNIFADETTVTFNDPKVIEAAQFVIDLSKKYKGMPAGVTDSWGSSTANFIAGKTAMVMHSSGSLANILKGAKFTVGVAPVPGKTPASVTGGGNIYLTAGHTAAERKAAWDFVRFVTDPARVVDFSVQTGYVPYRQGALDSKAWKDYVAKTPQAKAIADILPVMGPEIATNALAEVKSAFNKYLEMAINGQMTPKAAMDAAQAEADKALKDYK